MWILISIPTRSRLPLEIELYLINNIKNSQNLDKGEYEFHMFEPNLDLHNEIMDTDNISSVIKERVNKIHEFQLYN